MIRLLQSPWLAAFIGCLLYLSVLLGLVQPARFENVQAVVLARSKKVAHDEPSWNFRNPEFEQSLDEIRREREALAVRAQQLQELQTRLDAERQELTTATQTVYQLQVEFDRNVIRIKDQEAENLKRQAKVLSGMSPEAAAGLINQMPEDDAVRILYTMKPEEASAVLEAMSKIGKPEAKRAATITERMRRALPPDPNAKPKTSL
jgi:flagellar motility protein MotE (MotC chaperone)